MRYINDLRNMTTSQLQTTPATGAYKYKEFEDVRGLYAPDVKAIIMERINDLLRSGQLVYERVEKPNSIAIRIGINGDSDQGSTKFNFQLEVKENNHSVNNLSILTIWFGQDKTNLIHHFMKNPMQQLDSIIENGWHVVINGSKTKVIFQPFIVADYMVLYSFFGLKGAASSYNCIQCERWASGAKNRLNVLSYEITDKFQLRDVNTVDP
uniref:Virulence protein n=1 Tax=Strongyloides papillosus TaxID=174720 RepID=A0A0N5CIT3_STREA